LDFLINNIALVLLALVAGLMLLWPSLNRILSGVRDVSVVEATQMINHRDAVVLDVREDSEYRSGHVPRSRHIPLSQLNRHLSELQKLKDRPVVVICRTGSRSGRACAALRKNGLEQVYNLAGGITAWEQANMPMER
jgi:rhodanese-related sulfurtransferase